MERLLLIAIWPHPDASQGGTQLSGMYRYYPMEMGGRIFPDDDGFKPLDLEMFSLEHHSIFGFLVS
ncbi:MAG: hypothetical protein NPIRA01_24540 [Nitrospirales bacterium]|nr:MAG: hypothetical protein NPIRA01_24540 [Nitrospirales bacterium]